MALSTPTPKTFTFKALTGYFLRSETTSDAPTIGPNPAAFGLIDGDSPTCWTDFKTKISKLQETAPTGVKYAVCWFGRHGQGYHNVAESKYGTKEWDDHWSLLNGDDEITWGPDPELTDLGKLQAKQARDTWMTELARPDPVPLPSKLFSSPFSRAALTLDITFSGILTHVGEGKGIRPYIIENLREMNGVHTCDKRNPKSVIQSDYPGFDFEPGFTEQDELWSPTHREARPEIDQRFHTALEGIFSTLPSGDDTYFSITAHSGLIEAALRVLGHRWYALPTGGVIPVVIEARESQ